MKLIKTEKFETEISSRKARSLEMDRYIEDLRNAGTVMKEFSEEQWCSLVDYVTVYSEKDIRFTMKDGMEIRI